MMNVLRLYDQPSWWILHLYIMYLQIFPIYIIHCYSNILSSKSMRKRCKICYSLHFLVGSYALNPEYLSGHLQNFLKKKICLNFYNLFTEYSFRANIFQLWNSIFNIGKDSNTFWLLIIPLNFLWIHSISLSANQMNIEY